MKCNFCGNRIKFSENSLTFKDGAMCQNCTIKYGLVTERGNFTVDLLNYCETHTVEEFKQDHKIVPVKETSANKQENNSISALHCSFCGKEISENEETLGFKDGIMCSNCLITYGLLRNNQVFPKAIAYGLDHTVKQFKNKFQSKEIEDLIDHESNKKVKGYITASEDEKFKSCDHSVILRRMIPGVVMILVGAVCSLQSFAMFTTGVAYRPNFVSGMVGLLFGIYMIINGIYFARTSKEWPKDNLETLSQIFCWIMVIVPIFLINWNVFSDFTIYYDVMIVCNILAYPFKRSKLRLRLEARLNGYDNENSNNENTETNYIASEPTSLDEKAEQIAKYKKLLDDNAISQEEYNKIKKDILSDK